MNFRDFSTNRTAPSLDSIPKRFSTINSNISETPLIIHDNNFPCLLEIENTNLLDSQLQKYPPKTLKKNAEKFLFFLEIKNRHDFRKLKKQKTKCETLFLLFDIKFDCENAIYN